MQNEDIAGVFMFHTKPEKKKIKDFFCNFR